MEVKKIGVIGAGQMGHGIALVSAKAGFNVILRDVKEEYVKKGISKNRNNFFIKYIDYSYN